MKSSWKVLTVEPIGIKADGSFTDLLASFQRREDDKNFTIVIATKTCANAFDFASVLTAMSTYLNTRLEATIHSAELTTDTSKLN